MNQREKLIELIEETENKYIECIRNSVEPRIDFGEFFADRLLANGVIVPLCKVGDTVYILEDETLSYECRGCPYFTPISYDDPHGCRKTKDGKKHRDCIEISEQIVTRNDIYDYLRLSMFGKTVFLTREEAEKALAERSRP